MPAKKRKSPLEKLRIRAGKLIKEDADRHSTELKKYFDKVETPLLKKDKKELIVGSYYFTPYQKFKTVTDAKNRVEAGLYYGDKIYRRGKILYYEED
jgi:hypothetical protein